jgi:hypothetical protein
MAKVTMSREWPDGDIVTVKVTAHDTYPDALDEARAVARRAFIDAIAAAYGSEDDLTDDELRSRIAQLMDDDAEGDG